MKIRHLGTFRLGGEGKVWSENWLGYRDMFDNIRWTRKDCARHYRRFFGEPAYSAKIHRFRGSSVTEARMVLGIVTAWAECERVGKAGSGISQAPAKSQRSAPVQAGKPPASPIPCCSPNTRSATGGGSNNGATWPRD
jgi:hypothetical protein